MSYLFTNTHGQQHICLMVALITFGQNKYQIAGEVILDKLNTKFYNTSKQRYVEQVDANEIHHR